jgi:hypothetical protein
MNCASAAIGSSLVSVLMCCGRTKCHPADESQPCHCRVMLARAWFDDAGIR